ncbi:MAG: L-threonylcarbamoyladenylate synthase [Chitinophagales bacterium]
MKTRLLRLLPVQPDPALLADAGAVLAGGGLVAFPTETVYGLGANALDPAAVGRIFAAKGRPSDNPLIVHIAGLESLPHLVRDVPALARALMDAFWPGPLTVVLPRTERVPNQVTAGLDTVAVRMPAHPVALGLIAAAGVPVAAPSANRSGRPSPTTAAHVWDDLAGRVDVILDGGPAGVGVESTVVDLTGPRPVVLRPGGLPLEELRRVAGEVEIDPAVLRKAEAGKVAPRSPGLKYTHYAPAAPLTLVAPPVGPASHAGHARERLAQATWQVVAGKLTRSPGEAVGLLTSHESLASHEAAAAAAGVPFLVGDLLAPAPAAPRPAPAVFALDLGPAQEPTQAAAALFAALRWFDAAGVQAIVAEGFPETGLGYAVMNRLRKAASEVRQL